MKKYYVVCKGRKMGIFDSWYDCNEQVYCYRNAKYKSFEKLELAMIYIVNNMPNGENYVLKINGMDKYFYDYHLFVDALGSILVKGAML